MMARLLLLGSSYRRNPMPQPLPAIERYDGVYFRIARKHLPKAGDVDVYIMTEELELVRADQPIPYKPPIGSSWHYTPTFTQEKVEEFQKKLLKLIKSKRYDEVFIVLNKSYRNLLPDLTPYVEKIFAEFPGLGPKAQALRKWLLEREVFRA